jgi:hypothetical protein
VEESSEMELEVMAAEREVDSAREKLAAELEAASESGRRALARVVHKARPVAIGVAAIAGVAVLAGVVSLLRGALARRRAAPKYLFAPPQQSLGAQIARQALTSAAATLAAAAARRAISALEQSEDPTERRPHANGQQRKPHPTTRVGARS